MDLVEKDLGKELKLKLDFTSGKLQLGVILDSEGVDVGVNVAVDSDYFLDLLADAIPGEVDDAIIEMLKAAFKK